MRIIFIFLILYVVYFLFVPARVWLRATLMGYSYSFSELVGMKFRKTPIPLIIDAHIRLREAGINESLSNLEAHWLGGGNVQRVVGWMIDAKNIGEDIEFGRFAKRDYRTP